MESDLPRKINMFDPYLTRWLGQKKTPVFRLEPSSHSSGHIYIEDGKKDV